jgi:hypothetical protein
MSASVSERNDVSTDNAESQCSDDVNWPAFYVVGGLMLAVTVLTAWLGDYASAANTGLLLAGGVLILTGKIREEAGHESRYWNWGGIAIFAGVTVWNLIRIAQAFMA